MYQQRALCDLSVAATKCLGFQMGVLHVEAKFTSHGPHLIEVPPPPPSGDSSPNPVLQ